MKLKRIFSFILSICMVASLFVVPTFADGSNPISFAVNPTKVGVGDTVTVTISNTDISFTDAGGIIMYLAFDKELLECTSVTGVFGDGDIGFMTNNPRAPFDLFMAYDSLNDDEYGDMLNSDGMFSFTHVVLNPIEYLAGVTATLTFTAKANGTVTFELYDVSYGEVLVQSLPLEIHTCSFEEVVATDNSNLVSAADCENAAVYEKICTCGATNGDTFTYGAPLGHDYQAQLVSPADCDNAAVYKDVCSVCGDEKPSYSVGDPNGHDYQAQLVSGADCDNAAVYKDVCSVCGDEKPSYSVGDPLGHDYQEQLVSPADCVNPEMSKNVCSRCGDETAAFETAPALGHNHVAQLVSPADCENAAVYKDVCACGDEKAPYSVGDPLGHDFSDEYNTTGEDTHWFDCANGCGTKNSEAPHEDADGVTTKTRFIRTQIFI